MSLESFKRSVLKKSSSYNFYKNAYGQIKYEEMLFDKIDKSISHIGNDCTYVRNKVDLIADTIGIIQHGKLLAEMPIEEIHKRQTEYISLQVDDVTHAAALLEKMGITNFSVEDKEFIRIYGADISDKALSKALIENGIGLESLGRKHDTLEDYFFQLTEEGK